MLKFYYSKGTVKKIKGWLQIVRKYLQNIYLIKDLYADYIKNSYNSIRKANNPIKKAEDIKEDIRKTNKHMKIFNIISH